MGSLAGGLSEGNVDDAKPAEELDAAPKAATKAPVKAPDKTPAKVEEKAKTGEALGALSGAAAAGAVEGAADEKAPATAKEWDTKGFPKGISELADSIKGTELDTPMARNLIAGFAALLSYFDLYGGHYDSKLDTDEAYKGQKLDEKTELPKVLTVKKTDPVPEVGDKVEEYRKMGVQKASTMFATQWLLGVAFDDPDLLAAKLRHTSKMVAEKPVKYYREVNLAQLQQQGMPFGTVVIFVPEILKTIDGQIQSQEKVVAVATGNQDEVRYVAADGTMQLGHLGARDGKKPLVASDINLVAAFVPAFNSDSDFFSDPERAKLLDRNLNDNLSKLDEVKAKVKEAKDGPYGDSGINGWIKGYTEAKDGVTAKQFHEIASGALNKAKEMEPALVKALDDMKGTSLEPEASAELLASIKELDEILKSVKKVYELGLNAAEKEIQAVKPLAQAATAKQEDKDKLTALESEQKALMAEKTEIETMIGKFASYQDIFAVKPAEKPADKPAEAKPEAPAEGAPKAG